MVQDISDNQIASNVRRRAIGLLFIIAVLIGLFILASWYLSFKSIRLEPTENSRITFSRGTGHGTETIEAIAKTDKPTTVRVKSGRYVVTYEAEGYATKREQVNIAKGRTFKTPDLDYARSRLDALLETEQASAQNIIDLKTNLPGYAVAYEKLYHHGEWYGVVLTPPDYNGQTSTQRVILHKKDGKWELAAGPGLVLTVADNSDVHRGAIYDINNH